MRKNIIRLNGHEDIETWPKISIIKPILSDSDKMKHIIESFFHLDYPEYEIHFCFQNQHNTCIPFIKHISVNYPRIKIFIHANLPFQVGVNNKILNICQGYKCSTGEYVWIVDENIQCQNTALKELITQFDHKDIALVHQIPIIKSRDNLDSTINLIYFSTHHSRFIYFCDSIGLICLSGMSILYDKDKLDEIGGPHSFVKFLAEDYHLAEALVNRGYKIKLSSSSAIQDYRDFGFGSFCQRMIRWTKLRFHIYSLVTFFEPLMHPLFFSIVASFCLWKMTGFPFVFIFMIFMLTNFLIDYVYISLIHKIYPEQGELQGFFKYLTGYFFLQFFMIPFIFIRSVKNIGLIEWRGLNYKISWKTIITSDAIYTKKQNIMTKRFKRFKELQNLEH